MKLILDFKNDNTINITTDDDPKNHYDLVWRENLYSLWYNNEFVWQRNYPSTDYAVASVVGSLVNAMEVNR